MANSKTHIWLGALLFCIFSITCNAPRKNPLDPHNPDPNWATLQGVVQTYATPAIKLSDVVVVWNDNITQTDSAGHYTFQNLQRQDGWLRFSKPGFQTDSILIKWHGQKTVSQNISLKSSPGISGIVRDVAIPNHPIANVTVYWSADQSYTNTNAYGFYTFAAVSKTNGRLFFQKENYATDSLLVEWNNDDSITKNILLGREPTLGGRVQTLRAPPQPIAGVKVTWQAGQQFTFTDDNGDYIFKNPVQTDGLLTFEKKGYRSVEEFIEWSGSTGQTKNVFLNENPILEEFDLYSVVKNYYTPRDPTFEMITRAGIKDSEGDIDSVYIECKPLNIKEYLNYNVLDKMFERTFTTLDLGLSSLREVVGYDFDLQVVDGFGDTFVLGQERVARVISDEIQIESPKNSEEVINYALIKWLYFNPGFNFTYHIKIHTDDDITPELVWEQTDIPADSISITVEKWLAPTDYLWEIWCVDEFNNRSRSKPGSFQVKQ